MIVPVVAANGINQSLLDFAGNEKDSGANVNVMNLWCRQMYEATRTQQELTRAQQELWRGQQEENQKNRVFTGQLLESYQKEIQRHNETTVRLLEEYREDSKNQQALTKECLETIKKFSSRLNNEQPELEHEEKKKTKVIMPRKIANHDIGFQVQFVRAFLGGMSSTDWDWWTLPLYLKNNKWAMVIYFQAFMQRYKNLAHGTKNACNVAGVREFFNKWQKESTDLKVRVCDYETANEFFPKKRLPKLTTKRRGDNAATLTKQATEAIYFLSPQVVEKVLIQCKNTKLENKTNWDTCNLKSANAGKSCKDVMEDERVAWEEFARKFKQYLKPDASKWTILREAPMETFWTQGAEESSEQTDEEVEEVAITSITSKKRKPRKTLQGKRAGKQPRGKAPKAEFRLNNK